MNTEHIKQGSPEWLEARRGRITGSHAGDMLVQPQSKSARERGDVSATTESYLAKVLAEILGGKPITTPTTAAMAWGNKWESAAVSAYEYETTRTVHIKGFIKHPTIDGVGCSPDGLVGMKGGIEIKCPYNQAIHLRTVNGGSIDKGYVAQMQMCMWITDREWWDFVSYDPRREWASAMKIIRVDRDNDMVNAIELSCKQGLKWLADKQERLPVPTKECPESHRVAHMVATLTTLHWKGEEVSI